MNTSNYSIIGNDFYNRLMEVYRPFLNEKSDVIRTIKLTNRRDYIKVYFKEIHHYPQHDGVCQVAELGWSYTFSADGALFKSYWIDENDRRYNKDERHYNTYKELLDDCYKIFGVYYYNCGNSNLEQFEIE